MLNLNMFFLLQDKCEMDFKITKNTLCKLIWESQSIEKLAKIDYIISTLKLRDVYNGNEIDKIRDKLLNSFYPYYFTKWQASSRNKKTFQLKYKDYLDEEFVINFENSQNNHNERLESMEVEEANISESPVVDNVEMEDFSAQQLRGRPVIPFEKASSRTKRRRIIELAEDHCSQELGRASKRRKTCSINAELDPNDMKSYMHMSKVLAMYMDLKFTRDK